MKKVRKTGTTGTACCQVEAVVSVDERGQMVLPKEIREKTGIRAGDKLAIVSWVSGDEVCCLTLMKTDSFGRMVRDALRPVMQEDVP